MLPESRLESTEHGLVPKGDGWFILNAREARWYDAPGRSSACTFEGELEGEQDFLQLGMNLNVLGPGEPMAMCNRGQVSDVARHDDRCACEEALTT